MGGQTGKSSDEGRPERSIPQGICPSQLKRPDPLGGGGGGQICAAGTLQVEAVMLAENTTS